MSSILTNTSAMVALQTLKGINSSLETTQSEISTGKSVASAKDNAAVWAISKVMESDVKGFEGISDSLSLGSSTVAVARKAAETVTNLLTEMKGKIVAAQEENVDRSKIQTDIAALKDQIASVVGAAQFNGKNLVNGGGGTSILSSLDRDSTGNVTAKKIAVAGVDFSSGNYVAAAAFTGTTGASTAADTAAFAIDDAGTGNLVVAGGSLAAGDKINVSIAGKDVSYTVTADDMSVAGKESDNVALGLKKAIDAMGITGLSIDAVTAPGTLTFTNATGADISVAAQYKNAGSGDLALLDTIDVDGGATDLGVQLSNIENMIQIATEAAAAFGSAESRIETQASFISNLTDSMTAGIGSLVDADMEETSARLNALQTQQQLGIQALSIANSAPQNVLSLFK